MQVRARIGLDIAERRDALVDALGVGEFAGVGDAFVVVDGELAAAERGRGDEMAAEGERGERDGRNDVRRPPGPNAQARPAANHSASGAAMRSSGLKEIHRQQEHQPAQAGAGEIGEIDAPERAVALQEHAAEEHRAGEEGQEVGKEDLAAGSISARGRR